MYGTEKCLPMSRRNSSSAELRQPLAVVDHLRLVGRRREVDEALELRADGRRIGSNLFVVEQVALARLARRVADHARPATDDHERRAACALEVGEHEDLDEVAHVERARRRVEADVAGDRRPPAPDALLEALGHLGDQAAPAQLGQKIVASSGHDPMLESRR